MLKLLGSLYMRIIKFRLILPINLRFLIDGRKQFLMFFYCNGFLIFFFNKYFSFSRKNSYNNKRVEQEFDNDLESMLIER